eukprot:TRINITY_DN59272_c0_g1_i1.p1 TRINITY_DN59272_c0_g1~~TRINITY_DN59272_c0_g1_i1.p1  ORF type:complete len:206 (+),score=25.53 TRINITY_DN59272_c0_g1_i1:79-696(+)
MRIEEKVKGSQITLVPYRRYHVPKYNSWMQRAELQELTESEPLNLEQELEMCDTWEKDNDKITFIIVCNPAGDSSPDPDTVEAKQAAEIEQMVGDVNVFFHGDPACDWPEVEVMVAETGERRRGIGTEAVKLIMKWTLEKFGNTVKGFIAKILDHNVPSINCFTKKLHFEEFKKVEVFHEVHFRSTEQTLAEVKATDCTVVPTSL